jgi:hypothetical protein
MGKIIQRQLGRVEARDKAPYSASDDVVKLVIARCTEIESGGVWCQRLQIQLRLRRGALRPAVQKGENRGHYLQ